MTDKTRIVLGKRPPHIVKTVEFDMLDESGHSAAQKLGAKYKYRTRREYGSFLAEMTEKGIGEPPKDMAEVMSRAVEANAAYLEAILVGWDLDVPMTRAALEQLCDEMPGAALALMAGYRDAIEQGRLGN